MESIALWEKLLIGGLVVLLILWMRPGIKTSFEQSRAATQKDWAGLLLPIGVVVLFVVLLISMVSR